MISLAGQIQAVLDALGIHLDAQSFENLLAHLHVNRLSWSQKMAIAVALSVGVQWLQRRNRERQAAAEIAADAAASAVT